MNENYPAWLVLAPHLQLPERNGADILVVQRYLALSRLGFRVCIVGEERVIWIVKGNILSVENYSNSMRSKRMAAVRVLCKRSHYFLEKFVTVGFSTKVNELIKSFEFEECVASFPAVGVWAVRERIGSFSRIIVETHNDEFKWFDDIQERSKDFLSRKVALFSKFFLKKWLIRLKQTLVLVHVSAADSAGFQRAIGRHSFIISPVGTIARTVPLKEGSSTVSPETELRLIFFGSLHVGMNFDALKYFQDFFFPAMNAEFGDKLRVRIAGSNPSASVESICLRNNWDLHPNLSDADLDGLIADSHFLIMPFAYSTGGKLKLVHALSLGVPVLGTHLMAGQIADDIEPSCFSSDPKTWISTCREILANGISNSDRLKLIAAARPFFWDSLAVGYLSDLRKLQAMPDLS